MSLNTVTIIFKKHLEQETVILNDVLDVQEIGNSYVIIGSDGESRVMLTRGDVLYVHMRPNNTDAEEQQVDDAEVVSED